MALIDPNYGGSELDISHLGELLSRYGFLRDVFRITPDQVDSIKKYGRLSKDELSDQVDRILILTE